MSINEDLDSAWLGWFGIRESYRNRRKQHRNINLTEQIVKQRKYSRNPNIRSLERIFAVNSLFAIDKANYVSII